MTETIRSPKTSKHLEQVRLFAQGIGTPAAGALIGFGLTEAELGHCVAEMQTDPERHGNPMGTLHGGIVCDLSDYAMGTAMATTLEDDETFTTLDLNVKFFKPVWKTRLRADARVTKRTRTLGLIECDVLDDKQSLVAKVFSTCMVLRGDEAKGR